MKSFDDKRNGRVQHANHSDLIRDEIASLHQTHNWITFMNKPLSILAAIVLCVASSSRASADTIIYSNDFDSDALGAATAPFGHGGGGMSSTNVVAADANFGSQYLETTSRMDNGNFAFGFFNGAGITDPGWEAVTTFKFDARFNTAEFTGHSSRLRMRARDLDGGGDVTRADLFDSEVASDTVNTYRYVINNTAFNADRPDLAGQILANTYEIYEGATLIESNSTFTTAVGAGSAIDELTLWVQGETATSTTSIARIDNFSVIVNSAVPEPSSLAIIGLGVCGLIFRRKRSN